ncbi:uncharacterized protein [Haliotis cracherodii]|uniref:uncharacterized protein isoform X1 n=2 Tax=Haliotis cracherodii TaxID=6455 RepID=UPI0039EA3ADC
MAAFRIESIMSVTYKNNDSSGGGKPITEIDCDLTINRQCEDGTCISKVELCPDEQIMNQNTILIMIVVGMAVVIFLIILYCFQQRQRGNGRTGRNDNFESMNGDGMSGDGDNASLYMPPPTYDEVVTTDLYPATPQMLRNTRMSSSDEPPMTPPPNYEVALHILAQSHESVLTNKVGKNLRTSPVVRRSISIDHHMGGQYTQLREGSRSPVRNVDEENR